MPRFAPPLMGIDQSDPGLTEERDSDRRNLVSFNSAARNQHQSTIRATAMVFHDPAFMALKQDLDRIAPSNATILIIGETGTGKELVARHIHAQSAQRAGPFIAVNCGALSDTLAEAELFGYQKGAFTGALKNQVGWFEAAHKGTIFLDEIGDLPLPLQVKLLRVLQEREVVRVGSRHPIPIDIRVVAATNVDLQSAIQAKTFREDLYFRLNVASAHLPPLRDRPGDIEPLAQYFLNLYRSRLGRPGLAISPAALEHLRRYAWPGNIRELENVIHNGILLARGSTLEPADLRLSHSVRPGRSEPTDLETGIQSLVERAILNAEPSIYERTIRAVIRAAYDFSDSNQVKAAAQLGMSRNAFRTQLSHLGAISARRRANSEPLEAPAVINPRANDQRPITLRIGVQKYGISYVLKARGALENALEAQGVRVSWREFPSGPSLLEALDRQEIDYCITGEGPPIFAQAAGVSFVYAGFGPPAPQGEGLVVRNDSSYSTLADLRGRTIALNKGSNVHYLLLRALQSHGMTLADVRCQYLPPDEALQRIESGQIDAWAIWDPILTAAQMEHDLRILFDGRGLTQNVQFHLFSTQFTRRHAAILAKLLNEVRRLERYIEAHPTEIAETMAHEMGLHPRALEIALRRLSYGVSELDDDILRRQQAIADAFKDAGLLAAQVSVRDAVWPARSRTH
jgi:aliphatic sulfonates family ABC transporter substrate-binding protein